MNAPPSGKAQFTSPKEVPKTRQRDQRPASQHCWLSNLKATGLLVYFVNNKTNHH
ncbi:hypothetical protein AWB82_04399 [Caballeronia glebae]|uniref:Uncharacterized protein n=1 Tax=Caballeronia glebae TaxID=1777143 RepID=A0A158BPJ0_9BURK|nr:hypothetical protein AWB82_04399 [Caballeronia glebae]